MNLQRQVGHNVRRLRLARDVPQDRLALEAKVALNYLSGIERGKKNPTLKILTRLAKALRVSASEFFVPVSENPEPPKNLPRGRNVHRQGRKVKRKSAK